MSAGIAAVEDRMVQPEDHDEYGGFSVRQIANAAAALEMTLTDLLVLRMRMRLRTAAG